MTSITARMKSRTFTGIHKAISIPAPKAVKIRVFGQERDFAMLSSLSYNISAKAQYYYTKKILMCERL